MTGSHSENSDYDDLPIWIEKKLEVYCNNQNKQIIFIPITNSRSMF